MLEVGGFRVAAVGFITRGTKSIVRAANVAGLEFRGGAAAIADALAEVRTQAPDLTILLAHAGGNCDSLACEGEIVELAGELDSNAVQLIVSGHTHSLVNTVANGIPIVQAYSNGTSLGIADLVLGADGRRRFRTRVEPVYGDEVIPDAGIDRMLDEFRPRVDSIAGRRIAVLRDSLRRDLDTDQFPLGNLLADAWRRMGRADVGLMNNGGIRADLPAGPLTYAQVFELHPFGNQLVVLRTTGAVLRAAIEHGLRRATARIHVSGLRVTYDPSSPAGSRIVSLQLANGRPVRAAGSYSLALPDFLATGGDGFTMLVDQPRTGTGLLDVDALIRYLQSRPQPVATPVGPRIVAVRGPQP